MQFAQIARILTVHFCLLAHCNAFTAIITQSNPLKGQDNELTVVIKLDSVSELAQSQILTLVGLKYGHIVYDTTDSTSLPLLPTVAGNGGEKVFGNGAGTVAWTQQTGTLSMAYNAQVADDSKTEYSFKFVLKNPSTATKTNPDCQCSADVSNYPLYGNLPTISYNINGQDITVQTITDPSPGQFFVYGERAPLTVIEPLMSISAVQSTPLACARNTISLTVDLLVSCHASSSITLRGLTNTGQAAEQDAAPGANLRLESFDRVNGVAVWTLPAAGWTPRATAGRSEIARLIVTNPSAANAAPALTASLSRSVASASR